jgi:hypothetical protein
MIWMSYNHIKLEAIVGETYMICFDKELSPN